MSDGISFFNNDDVTKHLNIVLTQTNYTELEATEKLKLYNGDYMKVIREFMGIPEAKKETKVRSVNQEIFRQIRHKLDASMQEYRDKNPIDINQVAEYFAESDEKQNSKKQLNN
jgi:hypothetical protein